MKMNLTLGSYPGLRHKDALLEGLSDADRSSSEHVQLCPQNHGLLTAELLGEVKALSPSSLFRFHANARVDDRVRFAEASMPWETSGCYFETLAKLNQGLDRQPYSLHAGERANGTLEEMADNVRRIRDVMEVRVAVEGLYPAADRKYLVDCWDEYAWLLESGLDFALDLSHLNIVAHRSRKIIESLTRELLSSEHCIEVHLSANDGYGDLHARFDPNHRVWWHAMLDSVHPDAVAFYEGNEVRKPLNAEDVNRRVSQSVRREESLART